MRKEKSNMERRTGVYLTVVFVGLSLGLSSSCSFWQPTETAAQQSPTTPASTRTAAAPKNIMASAPSAQWVVEKYTDLPIPTGFDFISNKSFVFMQGTLRSADLTYDGSTSSSKLIRFYQDSMPANGWKLIRITGMMMKSMTFVKGGERCEITIHMRTNDKDPQLVHTRLHIKLNPY